VLTMNGGGGDGDGSAMMYSHFPEILIKTNIH
jgi:hypothetical protein